MVSKKAKEDISKKTPGQIIKVAREVKNISVSEVAKNLLLGKHIVIALEEDDYSKIPAQVYAEGYLKAYAQFLQIPVDTMLASFRQLAVYTDSEVEAGNTISDDKVCCGLVDWFKSGGILFMSLKIFALVAFALIVFFVTRAFLVTDGEFRSIFGKSKGQYQVAKSDETSKKNSKNEEEELPAAFGGVKVDFQE